MLAKALNAKRGRVNTFWCGDEPRNVELVTVELVTGEDVSERMAYTLATPVSADLVRRSTRRPGLRPAARVVR